MRRLFIFVGVVQISMHVLAQDLTEEFARFRSSQEQAFLIEQQRQDSAFAMAVRENWKSFQLNQPYEYLPEYPKPEQQPENQEPLRSIHHDATPEKVKLRSFSPVTYEQLDFFPEEDLMAAFGFFGKECTLKYSSGLLVDVAYAPSKDYLAEFWQQASKTPYQKLVNDLVQLKSSLNIPGYGLTVLVSSFTDQLSMTVEEKVVYQWFLLSKAGYVAKVGFAEERPVLIVASDTKIFGKPYFREGDRVYYVLADQVKEIETYGSVPSQAEATLDFIFEEAPDLPLAPVSKTYQFVHGGTEYQWEIHYNQNVVDLMEQFPLVEIPSYLNSKGSFLLEKSLKKQLSSHLENLTQVERVGLLLSFTQKAFEYQTDQIQFGKEKILYPDQFIHYPFSDCDDRVVFLNYLLGLFTEVKTVALLFPQHIALGAKIPMSTFGETVDYAGNRFVFCDPTFYNAPLGTVIPQADRDKMKVLSF